MEIGTGSDMTVIDGVGYSPLALKNKINFQGAFEDAVARGYKGTHSEFCDMALVFGSDSANGDLDDFVDSLFTGKESTVRAILDLIARSDVIVVGDSPYLHSVDVDSINGDPDNQIVHASWHDAEGQQYCVIFTEGGLASGRWEGNEFVAEDHEGDETRIKFYKLEPIKHTH
jgi:hypothetical protein